MPPSQSPDWELAQFAAGLKYDRLSTATVAAVKRNVLDTIATGLAGSGAPGVAPLLAQAAEEGGSPQAAVWVHGLRVPARTAALVNGTMAHALDFDDTHDGAVLHAGVTVVPAALAAAEYRGGASGAELIAAVAAGIEVVCRLGLATRPWIGWMLTPLYGYFGAAAAAGRILGLSPAEMLNAWGIAYAQAAGNSEGITSGALTKRLQAGLASQGGLLSALLARRGITGALQPFSGGKGLFPLYQRGEWDPAALTDKLGASFEVERLSYKPYPCCRWTHTAIDAALALAGSGLEPDRIAEVLIRTGKEAYNLCEPVAVKHRPRTVVDAQFSVPYTVAVALVYGRVSVEHFTEGALADPRVLAVTGRVRSELDAQLAARPSRSISPTTVLLRLTDGTERSALVEVPKGHPERPMTDGDLVAKFRACALHAAVRLDPGWTERTVEQLLRLEGVADVRQLVPLPEEKGEVLTV